MLTQNQLPANYGVEFRRLQAQLRDRWQKIDEFDRSDCDILVVASLTLDSQELQKIPGVAHYEERHLFSLMRLQNPRTRLIYVTSQPLHPMAIEYYLHLLPGIPFSHARDRLLLFSTYDSSPKSLTQKILDRPRLMERIRQALRPEKSYMICYNSTPYERELSVKLDIPLLALDPDLLEWGTKSGSRQIFAECGIPHPPGSELVWTAEDLAEATVEVWEKNQPLSQMVIKLNEGFSGEGNALLDLRFLNEFSPGERVKALRDRFPLMRFQANGETWDNFSRRIPELGAIAEAFIAGKNKRSPSVQGRITPSQEVEILSTHDQILGGSDGQIFLGCRFPADEAYRLQLQDLGMRVGQNLADKGALERYGVDFIAVPQQVGDRVEWEVFAIEINLRKGGTTHPFMGLKLLTKGRYDRATGLFYSQHGRAKFYRATDNLKKNRYIGLLPNDLMDIIADRQLHFDTSTETGSVFHLMGCLSQFGKIGLTSIGNSPQQAEALYNQVIKVLDEETGNLTESTGRSFPPSNPITWNGSHANHYPSSDEN
ncbi:peptide ligase PGM1-related protein [Phormidium sp. CCY1219]|uniref:peptide ligase PGM1-related protein n=1 Tax=Phormidium sp. CCY1219 TaxID=2886104 RepID=UPI002D1E7237|nr:peptide ligase PGM1-related protein [Phormidium sp. CCY1219]MEB3829659.1 peptide ligase PGM1-related protein [Phormidium sp. CCY1219]